MKVNKIIVRMPNWLGDFIMALPVLEELKKKYSHSHITVMCHPSFFPLVKNNEAIDSLFCYEKPKRFFGKEQKNIIDRLQQGNFDWGVLLTNSFSSSYLFWKGKVKQRLGYIAHFRQFFINIKMKFPAKINSMHLVDVYKNLLLPLSINPSDTSPKIALLQEDINAAKLCLKKYGYIEEKKLIGINPLAAYGPAKCWPKERFSSLIDNLLEDENLYVVVVGDKLSVKYIDEIIKNKNKRVINLAGKTNIIELASTVKLCNAFVTNDSGPMHMAAALKVPLIAIFGSTCDIRTGPYKHGMVIHKRVSCSPCYKRTCDSDFSCMKKIEVDEVLARLKEII